ncbi:MAG: hypothetical protein HUN04_11385 [Desulfobacter sp.]|nr:MAG: hypothetical protein HUN04_11385 [Desulfobacter sp.]
MGLASLAILMASLVPVSADSGRGPGRGPRGNILRYALHSSKLGSFDPDFGKGSQNHTYADLVFNALWRYLPGDARTMEPDLAAAMPRFKILRGRQIWTVHLRHKVFFHPSPYCPAHELTAEDVAFSLKKAANPKTSVFSGEFRNMDFRVVNSHTLEISLDKSVSPLFFLSSLANWRGGYILSKQAIEKGGYENFLKHPVGTGPFRFSSHVPGEKITLLANAQYFRGRPKLDGVEIHFMPDNEKREAAFRSGEMDVIYGVGTPGWLEKMEKEPDTLVDVFGPGFTGMFHFNTSMTPLGDIRVRKALISAMDRRAFLAASSKRLVSPVYSPMSPMFLPGGMTNERVEELGLAPVCDIGAARKMLDKAGYPNGFDLDTAVSEKRLYRESYRVLKEQLARINVNLKLAVVPHSQYHKMIRDNRNAIVLYFTFRHNADNYLRGFFHSEAIVKTGKRPHTNFSHYTGIDRLLDDVLGLTDPRQQIVLWQQAQIKILSDAVVYPLFDINRLTVRRNYVDYGHPLRSSLSDYPQFTENTRLLRPVP